MKRKLILILSFTIILTIVAFFIGMNVGGNYYPDFEFMGGKGYEATGYLGALIGAVLGLIIGVMLSQKQNDKIV